MGWRDIIRYGVVEREGTDDAPIPLQQTKALGKVSKPIPVYLPYGLHANVPAGTPNFLMRILGQSSNRFLMPTSWRKRPKNSPPGDVVLYQPETARDGKDPTTQIRLHANGDVTIDLGLFETGRVLTLISPLTKILGEVQIFGNLTVAHFLGGGDFEVTSGNLKAGTKNVGDDHAHNQGADAGGDAQVPTDGPNP